MCYPRAGARAGQLDGRDMARINRKTNRIYAGAVGGRRRAARTSRGSSVCYPVTLPCASCARCATSGGRSPWKVSTIEIVSGSGRHIWHTAHSSPVENSGIHHIAVCISDSTPEPDDFSLALGFHRSGTDRSCGGVYRCGTRREGDRVPWGSSAGS